MTESQCVHAIANLEGRLFKVFTKSIQLGTTLEDLDLRVRRLEKATDVYGPPPMLQATWDSLAYRIRYIENKRKNTVPPSPIIPVIVASSEKTLSNGVMTDCTTLDQTKGIVKVISTLVSDTTPPLHIWRQDSAHKDDARADETLQLAVLAEYLCYVAGHYNSKVADFDETPASVHELALQVSLKITTSSSGRGPQRPVSLPTPMSPVSHASKKMCCGCCGCHCHKLRPAMPPKRRTRQLKNTVIGRLRNIWPFTAIRRANSYSSSSSSLESVFD